MNSLLVYIVIAVIVGLISGLAFFFFYKRTLTDKIQNIQKEREAILKSSQRESESIKKEAVISAKDLAYKFKVEAEKEIRERTKELNQFDRRLRQKEDIIEKKLDNVERREGELSKKEREFNSIEKSLLEKENQYVQLIKNEMESLEHISGMNSGDAKKELFKRIEEESRFESAKLAKKIEDETKEISEKRAKEIIGLAIQRYSNEYVVDATVSAVNIPVEEMKGRIIGREGRNIRAFEAATGVEIMVDDTPELVILSAFDPIRREIARISLERLISDGRIHPARIEEIVDKVKKEVETTICEEGDKAVFELGVPGIPQDLVKLIGKLKYRTSYGQNVLQHSKEVSYLASMMAGELGMNVKMAKRAGLLHDIGKAIDHEVEGSHQEIGGSLAQKYGENSQVINAILAHHGDIEYTSVESALVAAADALSAARPGVRKETIENYLKRLTNLEELAMSFEGVEKCYAIQAGREIRIIVKPEQITDEMSAIIANDLSKKIESTLTYPGQIKITVIRESRFIDYAK